MSDLIEFLVEVFLEGVIEVAQSNKSPKTVRLAIYFVIFSVVSGFLYLSFVMREDIVMFLTFSITGSLLSLWLLFMLNNYAKDYKQK
ncbi:hypothetical protein [Alkalibacterium sp. 20]|uniref:hypothetical protein n=1 Tax=Alkalibacterium sp. 20 TaxID=1798803 RepID=UPI0009004672|nr:hypothetical protein [Alkalibacterium sp. 20]OJF94028.1 hypothetical protein AX762_08135 [Alkalibacterium sp. 20]